MHHVDICLKLSTTGSIVGFKLTLKQILLYQRLMNLARKVLGTNTRLTKPFVSNFRAAWIILQP